MSSSIVELVDNLPTDNLTVKVIKALDYIVPGEWSNFLSFNDAIEAVTGETDPEIIEQIRDRAIELYEDKKQGYQTAVWLYQTVDNTDKAVAAAALADKIGDTFRFIPFLDKLTPKADTVQSIDLKLKLVVELIAYAKINDLTLNPSKFAADLTEHYRQEALIRMAALVALDGILPLGADFIAKIRTEETEQDASALQQNLAFRAISDFIPGSDKLGFLNESFSAVSDWMDNLTESVGLNRQSLSNYLGTIIEIADDKLDYLAAFIDGTTNYFEHTGIQTVARSVIKRAYEEIQ